MEIFFELCFTVALSLTISFALVNFLSLSFEHNAVPELHPEITQNAVEEEHKRHCKFEDQDLGAEANSTEKDESPMEVENTKRRKDDDDDDDSDWERIEATEYDLVTQFTSAAAFVSTNNRTMEEISRLDGKMKLKLFGKNSGR